MTDPRLARTTTPPACEHAHCTQPAATIDGINGRRCTTHAPTFNLTTAADLARTDPAAALAYVRTWAEAP